MTWIYMNVIWSSKRLLGAVNGHYNFQRNSNGQHFIFPTFQLLFFLSGSARIINLQISFIIFIFFFVFII